MNIYAMVWELTINPPRREPPTIEEIFDIVAKYYNLPVIRLMTHGRQWNIIEPRQMAWKMIRELNKGLSLVEIGSYVVDGYKFDHTTVMHGLKAIQKRIDTDTETAYRYTQILNRFKNRL